MAYSSIRASRYRSALLLGAVAATLLEARLAHARSAGISSLEFFPPPGTRDPALGCHNCHVNPAQGTAGAGVAPAVALFADDSSLMTGQQITLTFTVTSNAPLTQTAAGFNIRADKQGVFGTGGPAAGGTRTIAGSNAWLEGTHSTPKANVTGVATFSVVWTPASTTTGTVTFTAWGNSVNLSGNNQGDRAASTTLAVTVAPCTPTTWYRDVDGDGFGVTGTTMSSCTQPSGYVAMGNDCDDTATGTNPGAAEVCDGIDQDCDSTADDGLATTTFYRDMDGDGFGATGSGAKAACSLAQAGAGYVASNTDCDDSAMGVKPGATEICNNRDDDCDNMTDEGLGMLTCGSAPCVTMIPTCVSGVSQTCTPVCPPDAGTDATVDTASDTTSDATPDTAADAVADTAPSTDAPDTDTPPADAPAADAAPGSDGAAADSAPASDSRPPDATGSDAGTSDARPSDSRDGGTKVADGEGCNCRLGGDRAGTGATPLLLAALLLSLMLRRRRR